MRGERGDVHRREGREKDVHRREGKRADVRWYERGSGGHGVHSLLRYVHAGEGPEPEVDEAGLAAPGPTHTIRVPHLLRPVKMVCS